MPPPPDERESQPGGEAHEETQLDTPLVLSDYLGDDGLTTARFLDELLAPVDPQRFDKATDKLRRGLRKAWFQGRDHEEVAEYKLVFDSDQHAITNKRIAETLSLSETAIGGWFNRNKGVEPENIELLRRYYRDILTSARPTEHELDLSGFIRAVSEVAGRFHGEPRYLGEMGFWRLWFTLRSVLWQQAQLRMSSHLKSLAASEINTRVRQTCEGLGALRAQRRTVVLGFPVQETHFDTHDASVTQLEELIQTWGSPFATVIEYVDAICWSPPHAR